MKIDTQNLKTLLEEKRYDEIRSIIKEIADEPLSLNEKGSFLVNFASAYLTLINDINAGYIDMLEETIQGLNMVNKAESETVDKIKLDQVKKDLNI